ncbi:hypothetical protein K2F45_11695 [Sphingobacterium siyangense]|uniref:hypothetical protein n=1 Tax=Sphingobacterium siyangense TaxID=459529 RepID=UPI00200DDD6F|nr:hypothetical protein [Sphingobacterium siyangense]UQA77600.1 hypothetical protein K2F45_11695 [Sphingobacterium siyangense]
MKKILNKIGKVLQVVLAAPVKWPGKAGNILKYIAVGLGILETVMEEEKPPPESSTDDAIGQKSSDESSAFSDSPIENSKVQKLPKERSAPHENQ